MLIKATGKLVQSLGLPPTPPEPTAVPAADPIFCWRAALNESPGRSPIVALLNEATPFAVAFEASGDWRGLPDLALKALRLGLAAAGADDDVVDGYLEKAGPISLVRDEGLLKTSGLTRALNAMLKGGLVTGGDPPLKYAFKDNKKLLQAIDRFGPPGVPALELSCRLSLFDEPAVRRLRVPCDITFADLHRVLQAAFNWDGDHLYRFEFGKRRDGFTIYEDHLGNTDGSISPWDATVGEYMPFHRECVYLYDFGDGWTHAIKVVASFPNYRGPLPILVSGQGDSPPDDIGGPWGFERFMEARANPDEADPEYLEMVKDWGWEPFDFDSAAARVRDSI